MEEAKSQLPPSNMKLHVRMCANKWNYLPSNCPQARRTTPQHLVSLNYALWVEFIDHQSSSSSPLPGRWSWIHLTFCLTRNKLQYEKRIKRCVLACSVMTRSPRCWPELRLRKSCMKQFKYCRMGERSGPSSLRLCRRNLQMTWALSE